MRIFLCVQRQAIKLKALCRLIDSLKNNKIYMSFHSNLSRQRRGRRYPRFSGPEEFLENKKNVFSVLKPTSQPRFYSEASSEGRSVVFSIFIGTRNLTVFVTNTSNSFGAKYYLISKISTNNIAHNTISLRISFIAHMTERPAIRENIHQTHTWPMTKDRCLRQTSVK